MSAVCFFTCPACIPFSFGENASIFICGPTIPNHSQPIYLGGSFLSPPPIAELWFRHRTNHNVSSPKAIKWLVPRYTCYLSQANEVAGWDAGVTTENKLPSLHCGCWMQRHCEPRDGKEPRWRSEPRDGEDQRLTPDKFISVSISSHIWSHTCIHIFYFVSWSIPFSFLETISIKFLSLASERASNVTELPNTSDERNLDLLQ